MKLKLILQMLLTNVIPTCIGSSYQDHSRSGCFLEHVTVTSRPSFEGDLLHVLLLAQFHEALPGRIGGVEDLLQQIQHQVGRAVLAVPLPGDKRSFIMNRSSNELFRTCEPQKLYVFVLHIDSHPATRGCA